MRGLASKAVEKYQSVVADFSKVIELEPTEADAFHYRAYAYHQLGEDDKALTDVTRALQIGLESDEQAEAEELLNELQRTKSSG